MRASIPFSTRRLWAAGSLFYGAASFTYSPFQATRCFRYHRIGFLLWEPFCLFEVFYFFLFALIAFTSTRAASQETRPALVDEKTAAKRGILRRRFQNSGRDAAIGAAFSCSRPTLTIRGRRRQSRASNRCKRNRKRRATRIDRAFPSQEAGARLHS